MFKEIADKAITLVKNVGESPLPISPKKYPRVLVVPVKSPPNPAQAAFGAAAAKEPGPRLRNCWKPRGLR